MADTLDRPGRLARKLNQDRLIEEACIHTTSIGTNDDPGKITSLRTDTALTPP